MPITTVSATDDSARNHTMATSPTLAYVTPSHAAEAHACKEIVIRAKDDQGEILGFVIVNKWLVDRPKVLLAKIIKDIGDAQVDNFDLVTDEMVAGAKPEKKVKTEKIAKADKPAKPARKVKAASGIERDSSTEQGLIAKWGERIVPGTLRYETDGVHAGKRTVEINCFKLLCAEEDASGFDWGDEFSGETRRVATSDIFQVMGSAADHAEKRKADRRVSSKMRKMAK